MKSDSRLIWLSVLAAALSFPLAGCQNENEAEIAGTKGTSDGKYDKGDDAAYRAHYEDSRKPATEGQSKTGKIARKTQ